MLRVEFASLSSLPGRIDTGDRPLVVMPFIDAQMARRAAQQLARRAGTDGLLLAVHDEARAGFVAVVNRVFRQSAGASLAYVAQDAFAGRDWLALAVAALARGEGGLFAFNDGKWKGVLAGFGLADRRWAAGNYGGDLFFPGYRSHYADAELSVLALQQRRHRHDPQSVLVEVDWEKEAAAVSEEDRRLYRARAATGFAGRVEEPKLMDLFA